MQARTCDGDQMSLHQIGQSVEFATSVAATSTMLSLHHRGFGYHPTCQCTANQHVLYLLKSSHRVPIRSDGAHNVQALQSPKEFSLVSAHSGRTQQVYFGRYFEGIEDASQVVSQVSDTGSKLGNRPFVGAAPKSRSMTISGCSLCYSYPSRPRQALNVSATT
jgi:hypothetical protein